MARPSQRQIAEHLGISVAAVSLALRRKGTVSRELMNKVNLVAMEMGYHPNPLLSSLASKRFRSSKSAEGTPLAFLDFSVEGVGSPEYFNCLEKAASELGYTINRYTLKELSRYRNPSSTLYARGVQGLVLFGLMARNTVVDNLDLDMFSVVQYARFLVSLPLHTARADIFGATKASFNHVRQMGYQLIGFALGHHEPVLEDDEARISAAFGMTRLHSAPENQVPPYTGGVFDAEAFMDWFEAHRPDAVIGFNHYFADVLLNAGYGIPEEVGYASMHLSPGVPVLHRNSRQLRLSGMDQNLAHIARECIVLMDQNIRYHSQGIPRVPTHVLVASSWRDGDSLVPH